MKNDGLLAVIGGTGFESLASITDTKRAYSTSYFGRTSSELVRGTVADRNVVFLARHGPNHTVPPHKINYRANIYALKVAGVTDIIAIAAVGGINPECTVGSIVLPDQIIDYTWGREHTYFEGKSNQMELDESMIDHIDFTYPYDPAIRYYLEKAAARTDIKVINQGTYGVTQGPRLETSAEVNRMEFDGVDIVGMTAMPEAALARELGLAYSTVAMVVNAAAGRSKSPITMEEIGSVLAITTQKVMDILQCYCEDSAGQTPTMAPKPG